MQIPERLSRGLSLAAAVILVVLAHLAAPTGALAQNSAAASDADMAYISQTYGIPLRDGYLLYDGVSDENSAAWSQFLTMNLIVSTKDPIKENNWGVLNGFFYWYYDDAARAQFIRAFAPPNEVNAYLQTYGTRKDFFNFFLRISEFERVDLIESLYEQIKEHAEYRPVRGALKIAYAERMRTSGYNFNTEKLQLDGWSLRMTIYNAIRTTQTFAFGIGIDRFVNARVNYDAREAGVPMSRATAKGLIARLHRASGEPENLLNTSVAPLFAGLYATVAADGESARLDRLVLYEDAALTRRIPEINGADLWTDTGAEQDAARQAEEARLAAEAAEARRQEEARQAAEKAEADRLAAERAATQARVASERATKPLAVLGITIGMTEAEARAALAEANPNYLSNISRTSFERLLGGSNAGDPVELDQCARAYKALAEPFNLFRGTVVGDTDFVDPWFLFTKGAEKDALLLNKSLELGAGLSPQCKFEYVVPGMSFETFADYEDETIRDAIRVYIGKTGPETGRVTGVLRVLVHRSAPMDLYQRADSAYGTPNFQGRDAKYWLADTSAPVMPRDDAALEIYDRPERPKILEPCIGAQNGTPGDLMEGIGFLTFQPYGAPSLVAVNLDLRSRVAAPCGTVLGIYKNKSVATSILLLDTDYVAATRQARKAAVANAPEDKSKRKIKF